MNFLSRSANSIHQYYNTNERIKSFTSIVNNRYFQAVLPVFSVYKGTSRYFYIAKTASETLSSLLALHKTVENKESTSSDYLNVAATISLVALNILNHRLVSIVGCSISLVKDIKKLKNFLYNKEISKSGSTLFKITKTSLSLFSNLRPSPEIAVASLAVHVLSDLGFALHDCMNKKGIEGAGKFILACVRLTQGQDLVKFVQRKWSVLLDPKFEKLRQRIEKAKDAAFLESQEINGLLRPGTQNDSTFLENHPLSDLSNAIDTHSIKKLDKENGAVVDFGANFFPYGKDEVKGLNINLRKKTIDDKEFIELTFKVNHVFREKLAEIIEEYRNYPVDEIKEFLQYSGINDGSRLVTTVKNGYLRIKDGLYREADVINIGKAHQLQFGNMGRITIGKDPEIISLYDRVVVQMDSKKDIRDLHSLLCLMDMHNVLKQSTPETVERLKIGHLFRTFFPREATPFERTSNFFELPLEDLKNEMMKLVPQMNDKFETDLKEMKLTEILPGRMRFTIPSISTQAEKQGALALISEVMGYSTKKIHQSVADILKNGMVCSEQRYAAGIQKVGMSPLEDHRSGGSDSVFTQMITEKNFKNSDELIQTYYWGEVQLIYRLEVLNTGTYQHFADLWGERIMPKTLRPVVKVDTDSDSSFDSTSCSDSDSETDSYSDSSSECSYSDSDSETDSYSDSSSECSYSDSDSGSASESCIDSDSDTDSYSDSSLDYSESDSESEDLENSPYTKRTSILEFINNKKVYPSHEVMIKEAIPRQMIMACIVPSEKDANDLKMVLKENNLIECMNGQEWINGIPIEKFIHISKGLKKEMLTT